MPLVVDASIAACWALDDEVDARADRVLDRLRTDAVMVPALWWFELRNILIVAERRGRIRESQTAAFLRKLDRLDIGIDRNPDEGMILRLARTHRLTVYDSAYLELACRAGCALSTLDRQLAVAAQAEAVEVI